MAEPTPLQIDMVKRSRQGYREIAVDGPVRQGKSAGMCWVCIDQIFIDKHLNRGNGQYGAMGPTIRLLEQNCGLYMKDIAAQYGMACEDKGGRNPHWLIDRDFVIFKWAGGDTASFKRISGATIAGGMAEEITNVDKRAYTTFQDRMSFDWGCFVTSCNPDRPNHWYRQEVIVDGRDNPNIYHRSVDFYDNQHYPERARAALLARNPASTAYRRNVLGLWVADEGAIFELDPQVHDYAWDGPLHGVIVIDEGLRGTQAALLWVPVPGTTDDWVVAREYYYRRGEDGPMQTAEWHIDNILNNYGWQPTVWLVDPAAGTTKDALTSKGQLWVNADNDIIKGIERTNEGLFDGRIKIDFRHCRWLRTEADAHVWDEIRRLPKEGFDHLCDCLRYGGCYTIRAGAWL